MKGTAEYAFLLPEDVDDGLRVERKENEINEMQSSLNIHKGLTSPRPINKKSCHEPYSSTKLVLFLCFPFTLSSCFTRRCPLFSRPSSSRPYSVDPGPC